MSKIGYIDNNGVYRHDGYVAQYEETSQYKASEHDRQRQDHAWELLQPFVNGEPNDEFIEAYPDEAKLYGFTPGEEDD